MVIKISMRILKKIMGRKNVDLFFEFHQNKEYSIISRNTERFINQYIKRLEIRNYSELKCQDWDALVVGSDQIWRRSFNKKIEDTFFTLREIGM